MGLIVLFGELHWNRGLCIDNEGNGFIKPNEYESPCHALFPSDEFAEDTSADWYFYKLIDYKFFSSVITWTFYFIHLFANWYIVYSVQYKKEEVERKKLDQLTNIRNYKTVKDDRNAGQMLFDHMKYNTVELNMSKGKKTSSSYNYSQSLPKGSKTSITTSSANHSTTEDPIHAIKHNKTTTPIDYEYNQNDNLLVPKLQEKYSSYLNWYNYAIFTVNVTAYFVHLVLTHTIYDGLASDVSIWSSQSSVLFLTFVIFIYRIPLRGLIFGITFNEWMDGKYCRKVLNLKNLLFALKKYHAYMFIWAIVYTFWYHPMEPLFGHLTGFSFIFLIFVQASLIYTNLHKNIPWTVFLECYFVFHSSTVAIQNTTYWKRFTNGPLLVYSITVIPMLIHYLYKNYYGTKTSPLWLRIIPAMFAFTCATLLRCLVDEHGHNECEWEYLSEDYYFMLIYYVGIPIVTIVMGLLLRLISDYFTNNKYVLMWVMIILFGGLNIFVVYSEQEQLSSSIVMGVVVGTMIIIQIFIVKWFWRLIIV